MNTKNKQPELPMANGSKQVSTIVQGSEIVLSEMSPIPRPLLKRLQGFQSQLDKVPAQVIEENIMGQRFKQLPITYVEHLLKKLFFGLYKIEVVSYAMIVNEVTVHVRLWVFHPILGQWMSYDGLAAIPVMQESGSKVNQFMETKKNKALSMNLPAAYSLAIKNAAKKIGKIFGGDLNRKHEDTYSPFPINDEPLND